MRRRRNVLSMMADITQRQMADLNPLIRQRKGLPPLPPLPPPSPDPALAPLRALFPAEVSPPQPAPDWRQPLADLAASLSEGRRDA